MAIFFNSVCSQSQTSKSVVSPRFVTFIVLVIAMFIGFSASAIPKGPYPQHKPPHAHRGAPLKAMPKGHHRLVHNGVTFFINAGIWYTHRNGVYVKTHPPVGVILTTLPTGFITISRANRRYYYSNGVYYQKVPTGYQVIMTPVDSPIPAETSTEVVVVKEQTPSPTAQLISANAGQNIEQQAKDKYECHQWAERESGFSLFDMDESHKHYADYQAALNACLRARHYSVN